MSQIIELKRALKALYGSKETAKLETYFPTTVYDYYAEIKGIFKFNNTEFHVTLIKETEETDAEIFISPCNCYENIEDIILRVCETIEIKELKVLQIK